MNTKSILIAAIALAVVGTTACSSNAEKLKGTVRIDGSSTVFPITEAVAEEFASVQPRVRVTVGVSGTGGGFKKFLAMETDINNASRSIKESESTTASAEGLAFIELPVAFDGITVVVNPANDFVDHLSADELHAIWKPGSSVKTWADVRPSWPARGIRLYGPGTDSGTFDYFTEAINGKEKQSRSDYTASEDDNTLVQGVSGNRGALGYFGYAYFVANQADLKVLKIDAGAGGGCVEPNPQTIEAYTYKPLARPIFIYPRTDALKRPEVMEFVKYYLSSRTHELIVDVGYIVAPEKIYTDGLAAISAP